MIFRKLLIFTLLAISAANAQASEYWAGCDGCTSGARYLAIGTPDDEFGLHDVHVYDRVGDELQSFEVLIYFDFEMNAWLRSARAIISPREAIDLLTSVKSAQQEIEDIGGLLDPVELGVSGVDDYLMTNGVYDQQIASAMANSMQLNGLADRYWNAAVTLASKAAKVIANKEVDAVFRVCFEDGSTMLVTLEIIANSTDVEARYVQGSARLANGMLLPDTETALDNVRFETDNYDEVESLSRWAERFAARPTSVRYITIPDNPYSYRFDCDATECVITVINNATRSPGTIVQ